MGEVSREDFYIGTAHLDPHEPKLMTLITYHYLMRFLDFELESQQGLYASMAYEASYQIRLGWITQSVI